MIFHYVVGLAGLVMCGMTLMGRKENFQKEDDKLRNDKDDIIGRNVKEIEMV